MDSPTDPRTPPPKAQVRFNILRGLSANGLGQIIQTAYRVVLPPLFIKAWGADVYGEWLIVASFTVFLALSDLGGRFYIVNLFTQSKARGEHSRWQDQVRMGMTISWLVPLIFLALFTGLILFSPLIPLLGIERTSLTTSQWIMAILALQQVMTFTQNIIFGVYRSTGLIHYGSMALNMTLFLQLIFVSGGLIAKVDMISTAILQVVPFALVTAIAAVDVNRRYPELRIFHFRGVSLNELRLLVKPSLHFLWIQLALALSLQGMVQVVALSLDSIDIAKFATLRTMSNIITQFIGVFTLAAWPELTRLDAQAKPRQLRVLFRVTLRSTLYTSLVFFLAFQFFGERIYTAWLGHSVPYESTAMILLLIYALQMSFWTVYKHLLMAVNEQEQLSIAVLLSSVLMLALGYIGGKYYGINGVICGMILSELALPFWIAPYLVKKRFKLLNVQVALSELLPPLAAIALITVAPVSAWLVFPALTLWLGLALSRLGMLPARFCMRRKIKARKLASVTPLRRLPVRRRRGAQQSAHKPGRRADDQRRAN